MAPPRTKSLRRDVQRHFSLRRNHSAQQHHPEQQRRRQRTVQSALIWTGAFLVTVFFLSVQRDMQRLQAYIRVLEVQTQQQESTHTTATTSIRTKNPPPLPLLSEIRKSNKEHQQQYTRATKAKQSADLGAISKNANSNGSFLDIIELSRRHVEPPSEITAAVCFKTLFGDIDLGIVLQWAAYNRLLGFDHIFMFYRPEVMDHPRFDELRSLPFATLTEQREGNRENYYDQWRTEKMCLTRPEFAANYDWAMVADIDEYLQFNHHFGIKQFLQQYDNLHYLSFGKYMYSLDHRTDEELHSHTIDTSHNDHFAVSKYPFNMKHYCNNHRRKGKAVCPTWRGRAKVIVRPSKIQRIDVHGNVAHPKRENGELHLHPTQARFLEWPEIFAAHDVTRHEHPQSFTVKGHDEVHIHDVKKAFLPADEQGNYLVEYDDKLQQWFDFVIGRANVNEGDSANGTVHSAVAAAAAAAAISDTH